MSLFSVPTGQTAAPEAAGMKADVPSQTEAAAARSSIYSRLIAEVHMTSRILQVAAPESVVSHPPV